MAALLGDGYERRNHYLWDTEKGMLIESMAHAAALAKSHLFTETVETDGTVPTFGDPALGSAHCPRRAHNGPDVAAAITSIWSTSASSCRSWELDEAKAKANGGRFTASASRAPKRRFACRGA